MDTLIDQDGYKQDQSTLTNQELENNNYIYDSLPTVIWKIFTCTIFFANFVPKWDHNVCSDLYFGKVNCKKASWQCSYNLAWSRLRARAKIIKPQLNFIR